MEALEKKIYLIKLFNLYCELLSSAQKEFFADYYLYDLSLSEISENKGISRSAVEDALKKASIKLEEYENKLHLYQKSNDLSANIKVIKDITNDPEILKILSKIEEDSSNGI